MVELPTLAINRYTPEQFKYQTLPPSYVGRVIRHFINLTPGNLIADLGGGTGLLSSYMDRQGFISHNVDLISLQNQQVSGVRANNLALPIKSKSLDAVHCKDTLVHIGDQQSFYTEVARVLKPGGLFVLVTIEESFPPCFFIAKNSNEIRKGRTVEFMDWEDLLRKQTMQAKLFPEQQILSPYFPVNAEEILKETAKVGFDLRYENTWIPEEGETDWYPDKVERLAYYFCKS